MAYVTLDEFKDYINNQQGTSDDTDLTAMLNAAERAVEEFCKRSFTVAQSSTPRVYVPDGTDVLVFHDCTTVTSIAISGTAVAAADYQLEPLNGLSASGAARPYTQARRIYSVWPFYGNKATVTVDATWGWLAVPDEVKEAVRLLAKDIMLQRQNSSGIQTAEGFAFTARLNPYVKTLLGPLRRAEAFGLA